MLRRKARRCCVRGLALGVVAMNGARLRVLRQWLGLDVEGLGEVLAVAPRTVRRWEGEKSAISPGAVADFTRLLERSESLVSAYLGELDEQAPVMVAYSNDEDFWAAQPLLRPLPAAWHRALVARVLVQRPDVEVTYSR